MRLFFQNSICALIMAAVISQLGFAEKPESDPINCPTALAVSSPEKFLGYIFEKGIDRKAAIGFHGTSLESIKKARLEGRLQTGEGKGNEGKLYMSPNLQHPQIQQLIIDKKFVIQKGILGGDYSGDYNGPGATKDAWDAAVGYASSIAPVHRLLTELGLEINAENRSASSEVTSNPGGDRPYAYFERKGFTRKQVVAAWKKSQQAKGVILAIGSNVLGKLLLENAVVGDDGLSLAAPRGVKLEYIAGLEPLDDESFKYFEALQSK